MSKPRKSTPKINLIPAEWISYILLRKAQVSGVWGDKETERMKDSTKTQKMTQDPFSYTCDMLLKTVTISPGLPEMDFCPSNLELSLNQVSVVMITALSVQLV